MAISNDEIEKILDAFNLGDEFKEKIKNSEKITPEEAVDMLSKIKDAEDKINGTIFSRRQKIKEELTDLEKILKTTRKQSKVQKELLELQEKKNKELAKNTREIVRMYSNETSGLFNDVSRIYGIVKQLNDPFAKIDHSAANFAKSIATSAKGMESLRNTTLKNVVQNSIAARFDVGADELIALQQNYVKAIGRNVRVSNAGQIDLAAMHSVMRGREQELITQYENFGLNLTKTGEHVGKMFAEASSAGLSFEKYSDNVAKNIRIAQNYTFKNGIAGLESMAKKATALRLDMQQVAGFADKVSTVEGAITTAAQVQVLGGPFAQLADPMGMLAEGLTDMEGLYDRVTKTIGHLGQFNRETGQVEVSAFNKQRIKAYAQATGMDYSQLMESINNQSKRDEINRQIASSSAANLPEQMKELIRNSGTFENGKAGVSINGKFYSVDDLKGTQMDDLIAETRSESEDIKDIAKNLRSLVDMRSGRKKQYDAGQADMLSGIGEIERSVTAIEDLVRWMGYANTAINLLSAINGIVNTVVGNSLRKTISQHWAYGKARRSSGTAKSTKKGGKRGGGSKARGKSSNSGENILQKKSSKTFKSGGKTPQKLATGGKGVETVATKGRFGKFLGKTGRFVKGTGGVGLALGAAGAGIDLWKNNLLEQGRIKEGDDKHRLMSGGAGALEGAGIGLSVAGLGSMVGGLAGLAATGYGIPLALAGALIGGGVALHKANKARREIALNNVMDAEGIELKGKYSSRKMKLIEKAMDTGEMSDSVRRALAYSGDIDAIKKIRERQKELAEVKGDKLKVKKANIFIEKALVTGEMSDSVRRALAYSGDRERRKELAEVKGDSFKVKKANIFIEKAMDRGEMPDSVRRALAYSGDRKRQKEIAEVKDDNFKVKKANIFIEKATIKGKHEKGIGGSWEAIKERKDYTASAQQQTETVPKSFDININGTLKLTGDNGQSVDIISELRKNPQLLRSLADMISKELSTMKHGTNVVQRV